MDFDTKSIDCMKIIHRQNVFLNFLVVAREIQIVRRGKKFIHSDIKSRSGLGMPNHGNYM